MYETKQKTIDGLKNYSLPVWIPDAWSGSLSRKFSVQYREPARFYRIFPELALRDSRHRSYLPIFESNGDAIYALDTVRSVFVEHFFNDSEPKEIGPKFNQLLAWLFVDLSYAGLSDVALDLAKKVGFKQIPEYLAFMETEDGLSPDAAKKLFVGKI